MGEYAFGNKTRKVVRVGSWFENEYREYNSHKPAVDGVRQINWGKSIARAVHGCVIGGVKRRDRLGVRVGDTNVFIEAARNYRASIDLDALQIFCLPAIIWHPISGRGIIRRLPRPLAAKSIGAREVKKDLLRQVISTPSW